MTPPSRVVVLGGGLAASTFVTQARALGYDGALTILAAETHRPYARPPLSKAVLGGVAEVSSTALAVELDGAEFHFGVAGVAVDAVSRTVTDALGVRYPYDALVIATGSSAVRLHPDALVLRTLDDVVELRARLARARSALVLGSGFLAWEAAAGCVAAAVPTTVVTRPDSLRSTLGPELADALIARAVGQGVSHVVDPGATMRPDESAAVVLSDGRRISADLVITAIGCQPNTAGLPTIWTSGRAGGSVEIDDLARVVDLAGAPQDGIYAAGDVALRRSIGRRTPLWTSAISQAARAARTLLDLPGRTLADDVAYCWTEAFGLDIRLAGTVPPDRIPQIEGDLDGGALLRWPGAAATVNRTMPVPRLKSLAAEHATTTAGR